MQGLSSLVGSIPQWVSAVGSIAAVAAGFWLNNRNQRLAAKAEDRRRENARQERLRNIQTAAAVIKMRVGLANMHFEKTDPSDRAQRKDWRAAAGSSLLDFVACRAIADDLDTHHLNAPEIFAWVLSLRIQLAAAVAFAQSQFE